MKKALVLTYYFPPIGLSRVQRTVKFVKYLPLFGWQATVLTIKEVRYFVYDPILLMIASTRWRVFAVALSTRLD